MACSALPTHTKKALDMLEMDFLYVSATRLNGLLYKPMFALCQSPSGSQLSSPPPLRRGRCLDWLCLNRHFACRTGWRLHDEALTPAKRRAGERGSLGHQAGKGGCVMLGAEFCIQG